MRGWQYNIRAHLLRCRPPEEPPPGTPDGPRLRPREGSKSEKASGGSTRDHPRSGDGYEANSPSRTRKYDGNEEERVRKGGRADGAEERSGPRVHRGRVVHAQGPRGEIRQRAPRNCSRRTTDSDTRSCTTTSTAAWAGERTCPHCNKVFSFAMHRYNCSAVPYEVCHEHLMKKRARSAPPAVIASWTDECSHCEITFGSDRATRDTEHSAEIAVLLLVCWSITA